MTPRRRAQARQLSGSKETPSHSAVNAVMRMKDRVADAIAGGYSPGTYSLCKIKNADVFKVMHDQRGAEKMTYAPAATVAQALTGADDDQAGVMTPPDSLGCSPRSPKHTSPGAATI